MPVLQHFVKRSGAAHYTHKHNDLGRLHDWPVVPLFTSTPSCSKSLFAQDIWVNISLI